MTLLLADLLLAYFPCSSYRPTAEVNRNSLEVVRDPVWVFTLFAVHVGEAIAEDGSAEDVHPASSDKQESSPLSPTFTLR